MEVSLFTIFGLLTKNQIFLPANRVAYLVAI